MNCPATLPGNCPNHGRVHLCQYGAPGHRLHICSCGKKWR